jgi:predicted NBD/HSP70 family sugar kinase
LDGKNAIEKFAALKKREDSRKVLEKLAQNIAIGIVNIVNILNPEIVILGGEVQDLGEYFYRIIQEEVKRRALKDAAKQLKIRPSFFGTISSNLEGAAVLAVENIIENVK